MSAEARAAYTSLLGCLAAAPQQAQQKKPTSQLLLLRFQVVLGFHACGSNVGDNTQIPLPPWVLQVRTCGPVDMLRTLQYDITLVFASLAVYVWPPSSFIVYSFLLCVCRRCWLAFSVVCMYVGMLACHRAGLEWMLTCGFDAA